MIAEGIKDAWLTEVMNLARAANLPVQRVPRKVLDRLTQTAKHQGVLASVAAREYLDGDELLGQLRATTLLVLLDEVEDPHNLGAIIRTAYCAGADAVVVTKHRSAGLTDVVAKASAGAIEHIPIARVTNLAAFIDALKERGVRVLGLSPQGREAYTGNLWQGPLAVVFGGEGKGLRRLTQERCDDLVFIPQEGKIDSLNVSVAVGIVLFEILRQRGSRTER